MFAVSSRRVLPGFTLSLGTSLLFVCLILLLPLSALVMQLAQMSWAQYWEVITNPQVVAAYKVTLLSAFVASIFNGVFGLLMAWILTRYRFPGRTLLDALMDLPFALPTAVAGLTLASLFSVNGFYGEWLAKFDIKVTYTWLFRLRLIGRLLHRLRWMRSMLRRYLRFRRLLDRLTRLRRRIRRLVLVLRRRTSSLMLLSVSRGMIHAVNTNLTNALIIFDILVIRIVVTF